ncbi:MAG: hypothetical protein AVDCRST_MAG44-377 [uncultured Sphingomonas sp.]|uniref:HTH LytTR-type domain-containing protein n=1 Tax=uncultured Sphingomonas sp. TaxID=158754 RepID=A0A6J4SJL8_9SPHN|nr:MAG: hypothetical protein AVDCRST_MAG44-377 [uncultured Sphingomonas sp.]
MRWKFHWRNVKPMHFGSPTFYAAALGIFLCAYAAILALTIESTPGQLLTSALANVVALLLVGLCARFVLLRYVLQGSALKQVPAHFLLALTFSLLWYWLITVLIGAARGEGFARFAVLPFPDAAARWQLFQGTSMYALVAVAAFAEQLADELGRVREAAASGASEGGAAPLFIKHDDDWVPLDPDRIILVRGADDYSEIVTEASTHLVRQRLGSISERLGGGFVRVHRSYVVNASRIARAEPTGNGTLQLIMANGAAVRTSRTGARLLRQLLI